MPTPEECKVLKLLAKEWEYSGPPDILDVSDIVAALDLAPSETLQALKALFQSGLVDMNSLETSAYLTPEADFFAHREIRRRSTDSRTMAGQAAMGKKQPATSLRTLLISVNVMGSHLHYTLLNFCCCYCHIWAGWVQGSLLRPSGVRLRSVELRRDTSVFVKTSGFV